MSNARNIKRNANNDVNIPPPIYFSLPYNKIVSVPSTVNPKLIGIIKNINILLPLLTRDV